MRQRTPPTARIVWSTDLEAAKVHEGWILVSTKDEKSPTGFFVGFSKWLERSNRWLNLASDQTPDAWCPVEPFK